MWQQYSMDTEMKDKSADNTRVDSGFISSSNLLVSSSDISSDIEEPTEIKEEVPPATVEPMVQQPMFVNSEQTVDSGLDLGLSSSFSQMSLKKEPVTPSEYPVQLEPHAELIPITTTVAEPIFAATVKKEPHEETEKQKGPVQQWHLYYAQNNEGNTPLHRAIIEGYETVAVTLIRLAPCAGLLDILNDNRQTPLHLAVLTRQSGMARRLVLAGSNPSIRNSRGNTPLHLACSSGDIHSAMAITTPVLPTEREYLKPGQRIPALPQDLEQWNYDGKTVLHVAAINGLVPHVHHLLRLGANIEAREGLEGRTALHLAIEYGHNELIRFLLQECQLCLETPMYDRRTAYQVALNTDPAVAEELLRHGAIQIEEESESEMSSTDSESEGEDMEEIPHHLDVNRNVPVPVFQAT